MTDEPTGPQAPPTAEHSESLLTRLVDLYNELDELEQRLEQFKRREQEELADIDRRMRPFESRYQGDDE